MYELKKSFLLLAALILASGQISSLYAQNALDGKTLIFYNHWNDDNNPANDSLVPRIGGDVGTWTGKAMQASEFGPGFYKYTFSGVISWATTFEIYIDLGQGFRQTIGDGTSVAAWAGQDLVYAGYNSETKKLSFSTEPPKYIRLLNPWPVSAPGVSLNGGAPQGMTIDPNRCGWYYYRVFGETDFEISFSDVNFGDSYGLNGMEDATPYNLTDHFKSFDEIWITPRPIPDGAPDLSSEYPADAPLGDCFYQLAATIRDFSQNHPNFQFNNGPGQAEAFGCGSPAAGTKGMVQATLGSDGKPVKARDICNNTKFDTWFNDHTDADKNLSNRSTCIDLKMGKSNDGLWEIDSRKSEFMGFWPIDDFFVNDEVQLFDGEFYREEPVYEYIKGLGRHNFHFCVETHADFQYRPGQKFSFAGDDDVWVYIDKRLVVDLGGLHFALDADVDLDTMGLVEGETYDFDFFLCERQATGSNLKIKTSIFFDQKRGLFTEKINEINGIPEYTIKKIEDSDESCDGQQSEGTTIIDEPLVIYKLVGTNIDTTLTQGAHFGGINITGPNTYWIDENAITQLGPGSYQFIIQDANIPSINYVVKISIPGNIAIQNTEAVTVLAGTEPVMVIVENAKNGVVSNESVPYFLGFGTGLKVFTDREMEREADLTALKTELNGFDTLWVWADRSGSGSSTYNVKVIDGIGDAKEITFEIPQLRFVDSEGGELKDLDLGQWTFVPNEVNAQLYWSGGVCTECAGDTIYFPQTDTLNFRMDKEASSVEYGTIGDDGAIKFFVSGLYEVTDYSFTIQGGSDNTTATYTDINLIDPPFPLVEVAEVRDQDGDGKADQVYIQFNKPIKDSLPKSFSYYWPDTSNVTTRDPLKFTDFMINDSTLLFDDGLVIDSILTQGKGYISAPYEFEGVVVPTGRDLADGIGPVAMSATLSPRGELDWVIIDFSEPILTDSASAEVKWFEFIKKRNDIGPQDLNYTPGKFSISDDGYDITFSSSQARAERLLLGDSLRLAYTPGETRSLRDLNGNFVADESRFVPVVGQPRVEIGVYDTLITLDNTIEGPGKISKELVPVGTELPDLVSDKGIAGVIIPFESFESVLGNGAIYEARIKVNTNIYTNLGGFVISKDMVVNCTDEIFNGNCLIPGNQGDIFISWNYKDKSSRAVGSGVYIVHTLLEVQSSRLRQNDWSTKSTLENYEKRGFSRSAK